MGERKASDPVVVLGFGAAAVSAVMALREAGYDGRIEVVTDGGAEPYSPPLTSYFAGGRIGREQCFAWADLQPQRVVDALHARAAVEALDVAAHEVRFGGGQRIRYAKLLIATGAHAVAPGFPQLGAYRPLTLRTLEDAERLRDALTAPGCGRVLVSGTSMVGLKVLEACLDRGVAPTLLGRSAHILRTSAHPLVAERFEQLLAQRGVALRLGQTLASVDDAGARGCTVTFDNGESEHFDEVVLAQGTAPNLGFVASGELDVDQGVLVDACMRASAPDVFAAGDVAQGLDLSCGKKRIVGLWQNAVQQGRCAGRAIAAELAGRVPALPFPGSVPSNVIHVRDILFASAGTLEAGDGVRVEMREGQGALSVFVYADIAGEERMIGFNTLSAGDADAEREIGRYKREVLRTCMERKCDSGGSPHCHI